MKENEKYRNPDVFLEYVKQQITDQQDYYIFIDEIQEYPRLLTLLKSLKKENRYKYICSGSQLGIALSNTKLIPMGSFEEIKMYPMDFEEFLLANSVGFDVIDYLKEAYINKLSLPENFHKKI